MESKKSISEEIEAIKRGVIAVADLLDSGLQSPEQASEILRILAKKI